MEVICLQDEAFYALIEKVVAHLKDEQQTPTKDRWIDGHEAMRMLRITSTTSLQKYRDEGKIRYSQPSRKIIIYDRHSIEEFIENNAKNTFNHG